MRNLVVVVTACLAVGFAANAAYGATVSLGNKTRGEIKSACDTAGGVYYEVGSVYGCGKENCDGKGGHCSVECNTGKCTGQTPIRLAQLASGVNGLVQLLRAGRVIAPTPVTPPLRRQ
jgi:hypothetical protein